MSFFMGWGKELVHGVGMTLLVAVISLFFGLLIGIAIAFAKQSRIRALRLVGDAYTTIIRGTPELLIVFFVYFGSTVSASRLMALWMGKDAYVEVPTLVASVFSLSVIFGGYAAESIRGAMLALPKGQLEAAQAYGFSRKALFLHIELPLIWRYALPSIGNNWLSLIKSTTLISLVGLEELMRKSYIAAGETGLHFRFYTVAAGIYLVLTFINVFVLERLEKHTRRSEITL